MRKKRKGEDGIGYILRISFFASLAPLCGKEDLDSCLKSATGGTANHIVEVIGV